MAALAAPLRLLVTLNPKKLKNAMLTILPTVDACHAKHPVLHHGCICVCTVKLPCMIQKAHHAVDMSLLLRL